MNLKSRKIKYTNSRAKSHKIIVQIMKFNEN